MHNIPKLMEHSESGSKRKVHGIKRFGEILERSHTSDLTAHLNILEQKETDAPKRSIWLEIIKLGAEINKMEIII